MTEPEFRGLISQLIDEYLTESAKVWRAFVRDLQDIWLPTGGDFLVFIVPGRLPVVLVRRVLASIEALQELGQDLSLVPARVLVDVVDDLIPVPDVWKGQVWRGDQALRWMVRESLNFGVNIIDLDFPVELDLALLLKKFSFAAKFLAWLESRLPRFGGGGPVGRLPNRPPITTAARGTIVGVIVTTTLLLLKWAFALAFLLFAGWEVWRSHREAEKISAERALSQNSKRIRRARPRRQYRENQRPGPD